MFSLVVCCFLPLASFPLELNKTKQHVCWIGKWLLTTVRLLKTKHSKVGVEVVGQEVVSSNMWSREEKRKTNENDEYQPF